MTDVSRKARESKHSVEAIRLRTGRRSADPDQVSEDARRLVGILNDGDDLHLGAAVRADEWIDFVHFPQEAGPRWFAGINVDLLVVVRQRFVGEVFRGGKVLMGSLPTIWSSLRHPGHFVPPPVCAGCILTVPTDEL